MAEDDMLRKNRGLGMLLSSMGNKMKNDPASSTGNRNMGEAVHHNEIQESVPGKTMNQDAEPYASRNVDSWASMRNFDGAAGNSSAGVQKSIPGKRKNEDEEPFGSENVNSWASMKNFDDDHDSQWFEDENARIAELYGGNFVYAKYLDSQPGKIGYYCELCFAEMNARKSLDLHCLGMKHLKKKALWEKMDAQDEDADKHERVPGPPPRKALRPAPRPRPPPHQPSPHDWHNRGRSPVYRDNRGHYDQRDNRDQYPEDYYNDYYRREPMPYRRPYDADPPYDRRGSPGQRYFRHSPSPARRDRRDQYPHEQYGRYERRETPPPPPLSCPEGPGRGMMPPNPLQPNFSPAFFQGLSDSSCSELLKKLAVCKVKNIEDSVLATSLTTFLLTSLKEYYDRVGPSSVVQVIQEMKVKVDIMKDLLKLTSHE